MSTEHEISYGGVVVRGDDVIVIVPRGRRRIHGLPKGGANAGERPEQTAAREVREETGINATVRERLGQVDYTYRRGGRPIAKTVHFFLCEFEDGDTADHDHEVDDARWMPLAEARRRLSYPGERAMIARALSILAANG
jgi:8-oxo-dGTP pyrophosphatase MutT (NUDIX family)